MSDPHEDFVKAFGDFLDKVGVADALSIATSIFVSLVLDLAESRGADPSLPITINGGDQRDITIHPPKEIPNDQ